MSALAEAKAIERDVSSAHNIWIKLALLQDLIAEIEELQAARPLRALTNKLSTEQGGRQP